MSWLPGKHIGTIVIECGKPEKDWKVAIADSLRSWQPRYQTASGSLCTAMGRSRL